MILAPEIRFPIDEARKAVGSIDGRDIATPLLLRRPYRPGHPYLRGVAEFGIKFVAATAATIIPVGKQPRRKHGAPERRLTLVTDRSDAAISRSQLLDTLPEPHPLGVSVARSGEIRRFVVSQNG